MLGWMDSISCSANSSVLTPAVSVSLPNKAECLRAKRQSQVHLSKPLGWLISLQGSNFESLD